MQNLSRFTWGVLLSLGCCAVATAADTSRVPEYAELYSAFETPDHAIWGEVPLWWWEGQPHDPGTRHGRTRTVSRQRCQGGLPDPAVARPLRPSVVQSGMVGNVRARQRRMQTTRHDALGLRPSGLRPLRLARKGRRCGSRSTHDTRLIPPSRRRGSASDYHGAAGWRVVRRREPIL